MPAKNPDRANWKNRTLLGSYPTNCARSKLSRQALAMRPSGVSVRSRMSAMAMTVHAMIR